MSYANLTKTAVSYIRIAVNDQGYNHKIPRLYDHIEVQAWKMKAAVLTDFMDEEDRASPDNRPGLLKLLKYITEYPVDYVIVPNIYMLSRELDVMFAMTMMLNMKEAPRWYTFCTATGLLLLLTGEFPLSCRLSGLTVEHKRKSQQPPQKTPIKGGDHPAHP
jgi:hypothetical protein